MMKRLFVILFILTSTQSWAEEGQFQGLELSQAPIHQNDVESIKRGAKFFAGNCMSCHTLKYLRYDSIAKEAGIATNNKPISINGVMPPDLSLEADSRGVNWIYTYLQSFYKDKSTASGEQVLVEKPSHDLLGHVEWFDLVKPIKQGSVTPEQFEEDVTDLVNFLAYAAEPFHAQQENIGYWVLGFLVILFVLMYLLKKEYWKDVKKRRE
jgi:ubiquinol-cytochrome c reductase cytochrome c1 subunit